LIPATALSALLLAMPAQAGWVDDAAAARADCQADPTPCAVVDDLRIRESRAGRWFVQDDRLTQQMLPVLLDRLNHESVPQLRRALAHRATTMLLEDDATPWAAAWVDLASADRDVEVRTTAILSLRRAPLSVASPGLRAALTHEDATTRALAADTIGGHADNQTFVDALEAALTDSEPEVVREAVGALGKTRTEAARRLVEAVDAAGDDALAREKARALERIDEG